MYARELPAGVYLCHCAHSGHAVIVTESGEVWSTGRYDVDDDEGEADWTSGSSTFRVAGPTPHPNPAGPRASLVKHLIRAQADGDDV
jgi:hypothetical protein